MAEKTELGALRAKTDAARAKLEQAASAPAPLPVGAALLDNYLDLLAEPFEAAMRGIAAEVAFLADDGANTSLQPSVATQNPRLALAACVYLNRDELRKDVLERASELRLNQPPPLTATERAAAIRIARRELHETERAECAETFRLNAVPRREIAIAAILGLPVDLWDDPELEPFLKG